MATKYLKEVFASQLKDFGVVDEHTLRSIKEAWLKDIADIDRLIEQKLAAFRVEESEEEDIHYEVRKDGVRLPQKLDMR